MKKSIVLNMQGYVMSEAIKMALHENNDFAIEVVEKPEETATKCRQLSANVVIMEVTGYTPWLLKERLKIRDEIRETNPDCKIVILVDENTYPQVAKEVQFAKNTEQIDMFVYSSLSASYLLALVEAL